MRWTNIEHLSNSMNKYVCKHIVDEKKIVLLLSKLQITDVFQSYTCKGGGGGGGYFNWRSQYNYLWDFVIQVGYLLLFWLY